MLSRELSGLGDELRARYGLVSIQTGDPLGEDLQEMPPVGMILANDFRVRCRGHLRVTNRQLSPSVKAGPCLQPHCSQVASQLCNDEM
jgi:hypothetical protein